MTKPLCLQSADQVVPAAALVAMPRVLPAVPLLAVTTAAHRVRLAAVKAAPAVPVDSAPLPNPLRPNKSASSAPGSIKARSKAPAEAPLRRSPAAESHKDR